MRIKRDYGTQAKAAEEAEDQQLEAYLKTLSAEEIAAFDQRCRDDFHLLLDALASRTVDKDKLRTFQLLARCADDLAQEQRLDLELDDEGGHITLRFDDFLYDRSLSQSSRSALLTLIRCSHSVRLSISDDSAEHPAICVTFFIPIHKSMPQLRHALSRLDEPLLPFDE